MAKKGKAGGESGVEWIEGEVPAKMGRKPVGVDAGGVVTADAAPVVPATSAAASRACARACDPGTVRSRLRADGRWVEAEPIKNRMIKEARKRGMNREEAQAWAYAEVDRLYPPLPEPAAPPEPTNGANGHLQGLEDIPAAWPELPANAAQQAELGWVQSNRLSVIEDLPGGATRVHLDRAHEPAPSRAALGWLETSIRSYAKYVDVAARSLKDEADDQDHQRRERMALDDIDELLMEMQTV